MCGAAVASCDCVTLFSWCRCCASEMDEADHGRLSLRFIERIIDNMSK